MDSEVGTIAVPTAVKEQSAPSVDIEVFYGNLLHHTHFRSMFRQAVEKRIKYPHRKLIRLINLTSEEVRELIKTFYS